MSNVYKTENGIEADAGHGDKHVDLASGLCFVARGGGMRGFPPVAEPWEVAALEFYFPSRILETRASVFIPFDIVARLS